MIQRSVLKISTAVHRRIFCWVLQGSGVMLRILDCHLLAFALLSTYISFSSEYLPNNFCGAVEFTHAGEQALGAVWIWSFVQGELRNLLSTVLKGNKKHVSSRKSSCWMKRRQWCNPFCVCFMQITSRKNHLTDLRSVTTYTSQDWQNSKL